MSFAKYLPLSRPQWVEGLQYSDVTMGAIASEITSLMIVYPTVYSGTDQRKHQRSASLAFVRWPVNSPHKWPVTRKVFPFDDVIMTCPRLCKSMFRLSIYRHRTHDIIDRGTEHDGAGEPVQFVSMTGNYFGNDLYNRRTDVATIKL